MSEAAVDTPPVVAARPDDAMCPKTATAARRKIVNCGVVGFTLQHAKHPTHGDVFRIDPDSIESIYGGFAR